MNAKPRSGTGKLAACSLATNVDIQLDIEAVASEDT